MTRHTFPPADAMPLREALRGLRFLLRRGGETIADTLSIETLPKPAASLAGVVLREVGGLARSVDEIASDVAKTMLGGHDADPAPLQDLIGSPHAGAQFATAFYVALTAVLDRLGARTVFVSEAAARAAFAGIETGMPAVPTARQAAELTLRLADARVMRGAAPQPAALVPAAALEPVSLFAVMLWIQSERSDSDNEAVLRAATDMAVARAADIALAVGKRDLAQIEALYTRYVPHV